MIFYNVVYRALRTEHVELHKVKSVTECYKEAPYRSENVTLVFDILWPVGVVFCGVPCLTELA